MIALNDEELLAAMQPENRAIFMPLEKRSGPRMTPLEMIELNGEHSRRFFAGDFSSTIRSMNFFLLASGSGARKQCTVIMN